jgi:rsbT co-antagonist protein RsbR
MSQGQHSLADILRNDGGELTTRWLAAAGLERSQEAYASFAEEARGLIVTLKSATAAGATRFDVDGPAWAGTRAALEALSAARAARGESAGTTSAFVLALKVALFEALPTTTDGPALMRQVGTLTQIVDGMAQWTVTTFQRTREDIISRQQEELLELSTPVIKLWDGVLAVPMIGTLDSNRTQVVMEALLQRIVDTEASLAIIDITGVPTVDTLVAQHLLKTVTAIRLMGADCIISGIRPQIAQTIVHLGIDLQGVRTKATLADALALALRQTGYTVSKAPVGARVAG